VDDAALVGVIEAGADVEGDAQRLCRSVCTSPPAMYWATM
jgi:hypothetical protein